MKFIKNSRRIPVLILIFIVLLFFWKVFAKGLVPFPGDLLLTAYGPWKSTPYNGYVAGAIPSKDQYFDVVRELYPWKSLVIGELKNGRLPLWNPYNFSGAPLLANYQSQVLYPLGILYFLLPQITAWTVLVISQPVLGSVFMYLFATEIGLSSAAAVLTALLFNFSSFSNVWIEFATVWHTILWLPLLLYITERAVKQKKLLLWQNILFIIALFSSITAGHPQDFINTFLFFCAYTFLRIFTSRERTVTQNILFLLKNFSFIIMLPFFLAAPQLLPTIELFGNSARVAHDYRFILSNLIVQIWQLPLTLVPDFFGNPATRSNIFGDYILKTVSVGTSGFLFMLSGLFAGKKTWFVKFFTVTAGIILLLSVRNPISELFYRFPLPLLSTGTPTRMLFILMFAFSVLAGIGLDNIRNRRRLPYIPVLVAWMCTGLLAVIIIFHPDIGGMHVTGQHIATMKRSLMLATLYLSLTTVIVFAARFRKIFILAVIPVVVFELYVGFSKFNPFVPASFIYPDNKLIAYLKNNAGINRFWGYGTAEIEANFATQENIYSPDGTDPLNLAWYNSFIQSSGNGQISNTFNRTTRSDAKIKPGYGETDLPGNAFRLRVMDALGVKYVIDRTENPKDNATFAPDRFRLLAKIDDWIIYENLLSAPRIFLTNDVRPYSNDRDFAQKFFAPDFKPASTVLLTLEDFNSLPAVASSASDARLISYEPGWVKINVHSASNQLLYISDTYDRGWSASVNDKPVRIYKANYAFRAVPVSAGDSTVIFTYVPKSFTGGAVVSAVTLFGIVIYSVRRFSGRTLRTRKS